MRPNLRGKGFGKKGTTRPALNKALAYIRNGDIFVVTKLDRLARAGQGAVHGLSGAGGGGSRLIAIVVSLFLHPVFSYVGFWLLCTILLLTLWDLLSPSLGQEMNKAPDLYFTLVAAIPVALAVLLRKIVLTIMKWIVHILSVGIVLFFAAAVVSVIIEKSTSG